MTEKELNNEYFDWMYQLVYDKRYLKGASYRKLLRTLHNIDFEYIIPMDSNRAEDGISFRYRFGYEHSYPDPMIAAFLDNQPCSVFEMLIALAFRCEEQIMNNPDLGNRTWQWFWEMIESLGLKTMDDLHFDKEFTEDVIFRFVNRKYKRNGEGGLFTLKHCGNDMRSAEIWYQMNWYLEDLIYGSQQDI